MSEITRFSWNGLYGMEELLDGDYVLHTDHEAEVARLRAEISELKYDPSYETACETIRKLRAELQNAAKAALDAVALSCEKEREADAMRAELDRLRNENKSLIRWECLVSWLLEKCEGESISQDLFEQEYAQMISDSINAGGTA